MKLPAPIAFIKDLSAVKKLRLYAKVQAEFGNEKALLAGRHNAKSPHQSILFFTAHKCASVYVSQILREVAADVGMTPMDLDAYFWMTGKPEAEVYENPQKMAEIMKPEGYLYSPFRKFINVPNVEQFKVILLLRDPRDVLTSLYYSAAYSHLDIGRTLTGKSSDWRTEALEHNIDDYVLSQCDTFQERYARYCQEFVGRSNVFITKYEDMVTHFDSWFEDVLTFLDLPVSVETLVSIRERANFKVEKEDVYSHKRQVTPGDHKRKLKPETIEALTTQLKPLLDALGYESETLAKV